MDSSCRIRPRWVNPWSTSCDKNASKKDPESYEGFLAVQSVYDARVLEGSRKRTGQLITRVICLQLNSVTSACVRAMNLNRFNLLVTIVQGIHHRLHKLCSLPPRGHLQRSSKLLKIHLRRMREVAFVPSHLGFKSSMVQARDSSSWHLFQTQRRAERERERDSVEMCGVQHVFQRRASAPTSTDRAASRTAATAPSGSQLRPLGFRRHNTRFVHLNTHTTLCSALVSTPQLAVFYSRIKAIKPLQHLQPGSDRFGSHIGR